MELDEKQIYSIGVVMLISFLMIILGIISFIIHPNPISFKTGIIGLILFPVLKSFYTYCRKETEKNKGI